MNTYVYTKLYVLYKVYFIHTIDLYIYLTYFIFFLGGGSSYSDVLLRIGQQTFAS